MAKPDPLKVIPTLARAAMREAKDRGSLYSRYIIHRYRATGSIAPGCDARDLIAWLDEQDDLPDKFKAPGKGGEDASRDA